MTPNQEELDQALRLTIQAQRHLAAAASGGEDWKSRLNLAEHDLRRALEAMSYARGEAVAHVA